MFLSNGLRQARSHFSEARSHLETTVRDVCTRFGAMVTRVEWNGDADQ